MPDLIALDILNRIVGDLVGRVDGPMKFRLVLQPLMAIFFAVRAGLVDARMGHPPYFWSLFNDPADARERLLNGWSDLGKIFALAVLLDVIYQWIVRGWLYPGEALLVATLLAFVPYLLVRGTITRIAQHGRTVKV